MATYSSTLAWEIPWTEEPGGLQSTGVIRVGHDLATKPPPPRLVLELMPLDTEGQLLPATHRDMGIGTPHLPVVQGSNATGYTGMLAGQTLDYKCN